MASPGKTRCAGKAPADGFCRDPDACAEALKALSDPCRLRIVRALIGGPSSVGEIAERAGLSVHRVSHHLTRMRLVGLLEARREGRSIVYSIPARIAAEEGFDLGCCCIRFRRL